MEHNFIPVNQSVLVEPIKDDEWSKEIGINPDEDPVIGSLVIPKDVAAKDKHGMVNYAKGVVSKINETEEHPFELKIGDTIVYNIEGVILRDPLGEPTLVKVAYSDVIVVLRK